MKRLLPVLCALAGPCSVAFGGDIELRLLGTVDLDSYMSGPLNAATTGSVVEVRWEVDLPGIVVQPGTNTVYDIDSPTFQIFIDSTPVNGTPPPNAGLGIVNNGPTNDELSTGPMALSNGDFATLAVQCTGALFSSDDLTALIGTYTLPPFLTSDAFQFSGAGGFLGIAPETLVISLVAPPPSTFCFGDGGDQMGCTDCPCGNNTPAGAARGCLNSQGMGAELLFSGVASVANDTLRFRMRSGGTNTFAILTSGDARAPAGAAHPCFGTGSGITSIAFDGLRCVVQNVQRHGTRMTDANGDAGVSTPGWGFPDAPTSGLIAQGGFTAGQTRHYQAVYRDNPLGGCGTGQNTTPGVSVVFLP